MCSTVPLYRFVAEGTLDSAGTRPAVLVLTSLGKVESQLSLRRGVYDPSRRRQPCKDLFHL